MWHNYSFSNIFLMRNKPTKIKQSSSQSGAAAGSYYVRTAVPAIYRGCCVMSQESTDDDD